MAAETQGLGCIETLIIEQWLSFGSWCDKTCLAECNAEYMVHYPIVTVCSCNMENRVSKPIYHLWNCVRHPLLVLLDHTYASLGMVSSTCQDGTVESFREKADTSLSPSLVFHKTSVRIASEWSIRQIWEKIKSLCLHMVKQRTLPREGEYKLCLIFWIVVWHITQEEHNGSVIGTFKICLL